MNKRTKEKKINLSAVIITKNEEERIASCLDSVSFADETIVIDAGSTDKTVFIAKEKGAQVYHFPMKDYASQRNHGLEKAKGEWLLYVDADERVSNNLRQQIIATINNQPSFAKASKGRQSTINNIVAYRIPRKNYYFGAYEWPVIEKLERLFRREGLKGWYGRVHESPMVEGEISELHAPLIHYTHRDLSSMTNKTVEWSDAESDLLLHSKHPRMVPWRFIRIMGTKFLDSYVKQGGWKAGTAGLIESMYQAYSYLIIYARLWERQNQMNNEQRI